MLHSIARHPQVGSLQLVSNCETHRCMVSVLVYVGQCDTLYQSYTLYHGAHRCAQCGGANDDMGRKGGGWSSEWRACAYARD